MLAYRFRAFALLAFGAMVVHQVRYALAPDVGPTAGDHAYLHAAAPGVVILVLLALGQLLARLRAARARGTVERAPWGLARLWPVASAALILAYLVQEWIEAGSLSSPAALAAPLAHGGWLAPVLAIAIGGAIALLLRGARAVIAWAARGVRRPVRRQRPARALRPPARLHPASPNPLASYLAGRAPPSLAA
jgi:hypothetical protein